MTSSRIRPYRALGLTLLGGSLALSLPACGPKDEGTISISAGDKTKAIEPDFGTPDAAAPTNEPPKADTPKNIKQR